MKASVGGIMALRGGVSEGELNVEGREYENEKSVHVVTELDALNSDDFI